MDDKPMAKKYLEDALRVMAVTVLKKYKPKVIAITGSVGKTSTKEAIFVALASHYSIRKSEKNYNNELGIPLTIIGSEAGGRSLVNWAKVAFKWVFIIVFPVKYPEILILELGADRPGDISYLTKFLKPDIGVITNISGSHLEFFRTIEGVAKEKGMLVKNLPEKGVAVLNIDNPYIKKIKNQLKSKTITYGFSPEADLMASDASYNYQSDSDDIESVKGLSFKLSYKGTIIPVRLNNVLAKHNIHSALAAIACGLEFGLNLVEIGGALENFSLPYGRMTLVPGIKRSFIIDDSYNSSPVSTEAALEVLSDIKAPRKIAVLGDMLELGPGSEKDHREVGKKFLDMKGDIFIGVGSRMLFAVSEVKRVRGDENVYHFQSPMEAGKKLQELMRERDLVLIKGSQGMRMEKVVEEVMSEPHKARAILCRQDKRWKETPWKEV